MATYELWAVGGAPNVEHHLTTAATLSADIETLKTFEDTVEAAPVKAVFESVIVILTLVRVRFLVPLTPCIRVLIGAMTRTK